MTRRPLHPPTRIRSVAAAMAGLALLLAGACATPDPGPGGTGTSAAATVPGPPSFAPGPLPPVPATVDATVPPGTLLAADPIPAPPGGRAWRIVYRSTSATGAPTVVTGQLVVPDREPPPGGHPTVGYAHATTGGGDGCAPSSQHGVAALPVPEEVLARGWAMVATDYEGLGGPGPHPYLSGASEAHAVLDAQRAATAVPASGVQTGGPVVLWGFSQGGHAVAFAAELAPAYAPDVALVAVALAAPVADVTSFARRAERIEEEFGVLVTITAGVASADPSLDLATVFGPEVVARLGLLEEACIDPVKATFGPLRPTGLLRPPTEDPRFAAAFAAQRAGDRPVGVPVLLVQGLADPIIDPADARALRDRWCAAGVAVELVERPDAGHGVMSADPFLDWTADRLAGRPARWC